MAGLKLALLLLSILLFLLAFAGVPTGRYSLGWLGLAAFAAAELPL